MSVASVEVLIEGFCDESRLKAHGTASYRPTVVLVRADTAVIVVDPGTVELQQDLITALRTHGVEVRDVTHVLQTHHHLDHTRNTGLFPDVPVIDGWATWEGIAFHVDYPSFPGVRIERTPGHTYDSLTAFVETQLGLVAICGDLLWWEGDTESDTYAENLEQLHQSRADVLAQADYVVPGHGPMFAVRK